jgi:hypothetical protein
MNVERAVRREAQERWRQQRTIRGDDDNFRTRRPPLVRLCDAEALGLRKREPVCERNTLDRAADRAQASSGRPVRLSDN